MRLNVYLLVCANEVLNYTCLNIHMWCTLVAYVHDADWLQY